MEGGFLHKGKHLGKSPLFWIHTNCVLIDSVTFKILAILPLRQERLDIKFINAKDGQAEEQGASEDTQSLGAFLAAG